MFFGSGKIIEYPVKSGRPAPSPPPSLCVCGHRPSAEMTSPSRATRWRAGSRPASPIPPSRAPWSTRAPKPRPSASTSRSPNALSSATSPCEHGSAGPSSPLNRASRGVTLHFVMQECEWHHVCWLSEREDGSQELVHPGQGQRQGGRYRQVRDQPHGFQSSADLSRVRLRCFFCAGRMLRTWRPLRLRSTFRPAVILSLSSTTRR